MAVVGEWVRYADQLGYLALPENTAGPLPGVVLIHDLLGLDGHDEDVARRLAAAGYAVLVPDLFAVAGERPIPLSRARIVEAMRFMSGLPLALASDGAARDAALSRLPEADRRRIGATLQQVLAFASPSGLRSLLGPLRTAVRHLGHERHETRGQRIAGVGEGLSALLACHEPELSAAAVFYGMTPQPEELAAIRCPVIAFYGAKDARVNAGIPGFAEAMSRVGMPFEWHVYEGAGHGFFNDAAAAHYDVTASRDAFARLLMFLLEWLPGAPGG
jgi:carboxymethylenebutenolidase